MWIEKCSFFLFFEIDFYVVPIEAIKELYMTYFKEYEGSK